MLVDEVGASDWREAAVGRETEVGIWEMLEEARVRRREGSIGGARRGC